jgi:hypothetical protein
MRAPAAHRGSFREALAQLGKKRQQLNKWIDRFGIDLDELRRQEMRSVQT